MTIFFTSDHHFYHANIIKYCNRPFQTVEEMNEKMVHYWNETVSPDDTVFYLGDFSLAKRPVELFLPRLNGTKHLIMGNHDLCHPIHNKKDGSNKYLEIYYDFGFRSLCVLDYLEQKDLNLHLCHFPYLYQEGINYTEEDVKRRSIPKYDKYRPVDEGEWLLCGHVHNTWKIKNRMINVGVDVWNFRPVSIEQIAEIISGVGNTSLASK